MLMLSGGIDSPVAGYLAMKRGVDIEMVHFFSPPYTSEQALNKAKELTAKLTPYVGRIQFIEVPFTEIQETVKHDVPSGYLMTIQRRFMLRLTEALAKNAVVWQFLTVKLWDRLLPRRLKAWQPSTM